MREREKRRYKTGFFYRDLCSESDTILIKIGAIQPFWILLFMQEYGKVGYISEGGIHGLKANFCQNKHPKSPRKWFFCRKRAQKNIKTKKVAWKSVS